MKRRAIHYHDFIIDKLTRSIENVITGDSFQTNITYATKNDLKHVTKKNGWLFDWDNEISHNDRQIYKLTIENNPDVIQGLVSLQLEENYLYLHLIESAPFNKGKSKMYAGVPGNLVAFACKLSFQKGFDGFLSFHSKTKLIKHYEASLGAIHVGGQLMIINTEAAKKLVNTYFKS